MNQLLLLTMLLPSAVDVPDGSLLVLKNSNKPVASWTGAEVTHVAVVVHKGGQPWVYEATPAKVRQLPLPSYWKELAELNARRDPETSVLLLRPKTSYSADEVQRLKQSMNAQLGRRYSIKGYVRGKPSGGIHCAEFVSSALASTGRFEFDEPHYAISPAEFYTQVRQKHEPAVRLTFKPKASNDSWCSKTWKRWAGFSSWCSWACYESWTFCR
ncbi:MAG: hypothetical protein CMJ64_10560 [Planctomycetaceae bacterium]|nr:hypothetical protein [Planctomycetaceae bacterium]